MSAAIKPRDVHAESLATSTAIAEYYVKNFIPPIEVVRVLNEAGVRFLLAGAHGIGGYLPQSRATEVVDVVVGYRQHQKATHALIAAFPDLEPDDQEVVIRLRNPESGKVLVDLMKSIQPLYREAFKHARTVEAKGESYRIPSLELALAMKFGPMVSIVRADERKLQDASDFISMVKFNAEIDLETVATLGELVYAGGGKEIIDLIRRIRAGEKQFHI